MCFLRSHEDELCFGGAWIWTLGMFQRMCFAVSERLTTSAFVNVIVGEEGSADAGWLMEGSPSPRSGVTEGLMDGCISKLGLCYCLAWTDEIRWGGRVYVPLLLCSSMVLGDFAKSAGQVDDELIRQRFSWGPVSNAPSPSSRSLSFGPRWPRRHKAG